MNLRQFQGVIKHETASGGAHVLLQLLLPDLHLEQQAFRLIQSFMCSTSRAHFHTSFNHVLPLTSQQPSLQSPVTAEVHTTESPLQ